jgi:hypothetical protein
MLEAEMLEKERRKAAANSLLKEMLGIGAGLVGTVGGAFLGGPVGAAAGGALAGGATSAVAGQLGPQAQPAPPQMAPPPSIVRNPLVTAAMQQRRGPWNFGQGMFG